MSFVRGCLWKKKSMIHNRSKRNRVGRENMIQECENPIVEDDFRIATVKVLSSYEKKWNCAWRYSFCLPPVFWDDRAQSW